MKPARAALEGMAERHPSRTILLFPEPRRRRQPNRRARSGRAVGSAGHRSRPRDRGGRAHAARLAREGAGEHRRAAAHLRPAGVPPLARRAAVGRTGARAARRRHRPADRRLDGVGRRAGLVHSGWRSSSRAAPPRTSRGRVRRGGALTWRRSGPGSRTYRRFAYAGRRRRHGSSAAGCARGSGDRTSRSSTTRRRSS